MAINEKVYLYSNSFETDAKTTWKEIQMEEDLCDVTFSCERKQIKAHKIIISACSPVLRDILKSTQSSHPLIHLRKVKYKNLQNLLNFMYRGEVNVDEEDLQSFLEIAKDFNLRALSVGKLKGWISNEEKYSKFTQSNNEVSQKISKTEVEHESIENINDSESIKYEQIDENFSEVVHENIEHTSKSQSIKYEQTDANFSDNDVYNKNIIALTGDQIQTWGQFIKYNDMVYKLEVKPFNCGNCGKQYSTSNGLKYHTIAAHEMSRISCEKCDYKASTKSVLNRHVKAIHEEERPYVCDQCDYTANRKENLKRHWLKNHD